MPTYFRAKGFRISYLTTCFMIVLLGLLCRIGDAQVTQSSSNLSNPYKTLDRAAKDASAGDDSSVRALSEAVFSFPRMLGRMPEVIENPVKDRLIEAELSFRRGAHAGVREEDIVKLVNSMADKLQAPSYAKTSIKQVRVLRMQLVLASPVFMGQALTLPGASAGDSVRSTMSPFQAAHLLNSLIDQKLINPAFQLEPKDWEASQASVEMDRIKAGQEKLRSAQNASDQSPRVSLTTHRRNRDLHNKILQASSNLSLSDAIALVDEALTTLKLNR